MPRVAKAIRDQIDLVIHDLEQLLDAMERVIPVEVAEQGVAAHVADLRILFEKLTRKGAKRR